MKISIKRLFVLLAVVASFVIVQSVWAQLNRVTVEGTVSLLDCDGSEIQVLDEEETIVVYRVPLNYLAEHGIVLTDGVVVSIEAYPLIYKNGTTKLIACSVTVDNITITLRDENLTPVWSEPGNPNK